MRPPRFFICSLLVFFLALPASPALAGPVLERILKSQELRVGVVDQGTPLCLKAKDGQLMGLEVDLVAMLSRALGVKLNLRPLAPEQLLPALLKQEVDLALGGLAITPRLNTQVLLVGPYLASGQTIVTGKDTVKAITSLEAMNRNDFLLGAVKGSEGETAIKSLIPRARLTIAPSWPAAVKLLQAHKVMALVLDHPQAVMTNLRHGQQGLVSMQKPFTFQPLGLALHPSDRHLLNLVENYLLGLDGTGQLEGLRRLWFQDSSWTSRLP